MKRLVLWAHNIRSCYNIGSLLRTADGFGAEEVVLSGYSPYPLIKDDPRLPHESMKITKKISKTALGSEKHLKIHYVSVDTTIELTQYKEKGYTICALEQTPKARDISTFNPPPKLVLILGNELNGVDQNLLNVCDIHLAIPMYGQKESFNVSAAAAIALYHCRFAK